MNMTVQQYQNRVLGPTEVVAYNTIVAQSYPPQAIQSEPFIGFKLLCRDRNAAVTNPAARMQQIDQNLGFLRGTGCLIRETSLSMQDGFWLVTLPVPRSQVRQQLEKLMNVRDIFIQYFGIVPEGLVEINVSGRCPIQQTEQALASLYIPSRYASCHVAPEQSAYKLGQIIRINDTFMLFRSRWFLQKNLPDDVVELSQLISAMFR